VTLPPNTVRGRIQQFLRGCAPKFKAPVLEIGSRFPDPMAVWANNRYLLKDGMWVGADFITGLNVDVCASVEGLPFKDDTFGTVLCSEVLEHVWDVRAAIQEMRRVLQPGGYLVITTLFAFPIHGYPDDYWRFTDSAMARLLKDFAEVNVSVAGTQEFVLNDHGSKSVRILAPMHIFALAFKG
jgi:SAM-dependent methyltransferase